MAGASPAGLSYRRAGPGDVGALVDLRIEFMRIVKDSGLRDEAEWRAELSSRFEADLASGELVSWLCLDGERVVAASGLALPAGPESRAALGLRPGEALVFNMYTRPAYRRRGIAAELLGRTVAEARSRGASALRLQPTEEGRGTYARAGFAGTGGEMVLPLAEGGADPGRPGKEST